MEFTAIALVNTSRKDHEKACAFRAKLEEIFGIKPGIVEIISEDVSTEKVLVKQSNLTIISQTLEQAKREALRDYRHTHGLYVQDENGQEYLVEEPKDEI